MKIQSSSRLGGVLLFLLAFYALFGGIAGTATTAGSDDLKLTVLYDNIPFAANLKTHWGFSCLLEKGRTRILFDTGANPETLLSNAETLKLDIARLDAIVFSHIHADHTQGYRGLAAQLTSDPPVYVLASFPVDFKQQVKGIEVQGPLVFPDRDFRTTGELSGEMANEQALLVKTPRGLVVLTGCAHPGVLNIVRRAKEISGEKIHLVMGGFHLVQTPGGEVETIAKELRALGVERVAPSNCTGEAAIEIFKKEYGPDFLQSGTGRVVSIDGSPGSD